MRERENKMFSKDKNTLNRVVVLIPSLDPDGMLGKYVSGLKEEGFQKIVIVNDGSKIDNLEFFPEEKDGVTILKHAVNQGKGRALKTGFHHVLNVYSSDEIAGVVTADADGQHSVEDTVKVAQELVEEKSFVLGTRDFNEEHVPFKSRNGNKITTNVFHLLFGKRIHDTQTGLRGIPYEYLKKCLTLKGERFEYEINMLIDAVRSDLKISEVLIQTIYFDSNRATHFSAVKDSARIYGVIFGEVIRFSISGLASAAIDVGVFAILTKLIFRGMSVTSATFAGTLIARVVSSLFNYSMNKQIFQSEGSVKKSMMKYYILCACQLVASWLLVVLVFNHIQWDTTLIKVIIDTCLFFISYQIQRRWVFREVTK